MQKSSYSKVLEALNVSASPPTRANKLIKIQMEAEDSALHTHLAAAVETLRSSRYVDGVDPRSSGEILDLEHAHWKPLRQYCEQSLASGKPEWQLIAERNGWRPG
ncbi:hypothetical protein [Achromobacter aegrifaciens]|uniref:hypothetical protein n=1 Tax=Achromobacter aegrifaciens TaxID=1287736 RepID=UPI000F744F05|nr:hypothetical protein [Achromobacter aegrifaciens]